MLFRYFIDGKRRSKESHPNGATSCEVCGTVSGSEREQAPFSGKQTPRLGHWPGDVAA